MPVVSILWSCMRNQITWDCWIDRIFSPCAGEYAIEHPICLSLPWISLLLKKIALNWIELHPANIPSTDFCIVTLRGIIVSQFRDRFCELDRRIAFPSVWDLATGRPRLASLHRLHVFVIVQCFMNGSALISLRMSSENRKLIAPGQHSVQHFWTAAGYVISKSLWMKIFSSLVGVLSFSLSSLFIILTLPRSCHFPFLLSLSHCII